MSSVLGYRACHRRRGGGPDGRAPRLSIRGQSRGCQTHRALIPERPRRSSTRHLLAEPTMADTRPVLRDHHAGLGRTPAPADLASGLRRAGQRSRETACDAVWATAARQPRTRMVVAGEPPARSCCLAQNLREDESEVRERDGLSRFGISLLFILKIIGPAMKSACHRNGGCPDADLRNNDPRFLRRHTGLRSTWIVTGRSLATTLRFRRVPTGRVDGCDDVGLTDDRRAVIAECPSTTLVRFPTWGTSRSIRSRRRLPKRSCSARSLRVHPPVEPGLHFRWTATRSDRLTGSPPRQPYSNGRRFRVAALAAQSGIAGRQWRKKTCPTSSPRLRTPTLSKMAVRCSWTV